MTNSPQRTHSLASCYENAITTIIRLSNLQQQAVPNAQGFRTSIRAALKSAMEQAKALAYSSEMIQLSFFAVVALLDESVLKLQSRGFRRMGPASYAGRDVWPQPRRRGFL